MDRFRTHYLRYDLLMLEFVLRKLYDWHDQATTLRRRNPRTVLLVSAGARPALCCMGDLLLHDKTKIRLLPREDAEYYSHRAAIICGGFDAGRVLRYRCLKLGRRWLG